MAKRQSPKLEEVKIPLDEPKGKLFPKPKKVLTGSNFSATIQSKGVKKNTKTKRVLGRKTDMQKTIKAQKYASLAVLAAGAIYGISQYTSDTVILIAGTLLVAFLVEKSIK